MAIYQRIKDLADAKKVSIAELERTLGFSNGSLYKWNKTSPSAEKVQQVADYFDVTTDYLLGRNAKEDPIEFYRIDTAGLSNQDVSELKEELDQYTAFLKSKLQNKSDGE